MKGQSVLVTAPTGEPLSVQEVKDHLRIVTNDDPRIIGNLIISARKWVEHFLERALFTQTFDLFLNEWPCVSWVNYQHFFTTKQIVIPFPPLQSVTTVKYIDVDGVQQTLASTEYTVDIKNEPGKIVEAYGKIWPATRLQVNAVEVRYVAGYGNASAIPEDIKQAMLMLIGHWYENREGSAEQSLSSVPMGVESLLYPYRVMEFA